MYNLEIRDESDCLGVVVQGIVLATIGFIPQIDVKPLIAAVAISAVFTGTPSLRVLQDHILIV